MIVSDMVSTAPVSTRRRTNSVAAASDVSDVSAPNLLSCDFCHIRPRLAQ